MNRLLRNYLLPLACFFVSALAFAQGASAEALVKDVTDEVLSILRQDKGIQSGDRQRAVSLIETKVAPHFDFGRMTSLAVGAAWRRANADQQQTLVREFRTLLIRTYANALVAYRDQTVTFKSSKPGEAGEVTVRSQIKQPGGRPIGLDYSLVKSGDDWKVIDVMVDNISLVTNYRSSFAVEADKGGIEGLIKALQEKNRSLSTTPAPVAKQGAAKM